MRDMAEHQNAVDRTLDDIMQKIERMRGQLVALEENQGRMKEAIAERDEAIADRDRLIAAMRAELSRLRKPCPSCGEPRS